MLFVPAELSRVGRKLGERASVRQSPGWVAQNATNVTEDIGVPGVRVMRSVRQIAECVAYSAGCCGVGTHHVAIGYSRKSNGVPVLDGTIPPGQPSHRHRGKVGDPPTVAGIDPKLGRNGIQHRPADLRVRRQLTDPFR